MLFRKKHIRACSYCAHGTNIGDGQILCMKRGIKSKDDACRKFTYDPCKRIPVKAKEPDFDRYSQKDFSL